MDEMDREQESRPEVSADLTGSTPTGEGAASGTTEPAGGMKPEAAPEAEGIGTAASDAAQPEESLAAGAPVMPAPAAAPQAAPTRRRTRALAVVGLVLLGALLGAAGGTAATWKVLQGRTGSSAPASVVVPSSLVRTVALTGADVDLPTLYERVAPGVVRIDTQDGTGTGFVVNAAQGLILTNYHVVEGEQTVDVLVEDKTRVQGKVLGTDPSTDLALVGVDPKAVHLVELPLGNSDQVRPGELAIAIGYPLGTGKSITAGIISGVGRTGEAPTGRSLLNLIQTDAAINPGNSGGPLLNAAGQVIGINTQILSPVRGFTGIGFAVPINTAKQVLPELAQGKNVQRPWLGIVGGAVPDVIREQPELEKSLNVKDGVLVLEVYPNSPAAAAGLRPTVETRYGMTVPGDVILAVDGQPVHSVQDITSYLDNKKPGDTVTLKVDREGRQLDVKVTLKPWPNNLNQMR